MSARGSEAADTIDILRAIAQAQAAARNTITLPVAPAGSPGEDPAGMATPMAAPAGGEPSGEAGRVTTIPPGGARPAVAITTQGTACIRAVPVHADDPGSGEARREGPSRRQPLPAVPRGQHRHPAPAVLATGGDWWWD